MLPGSGLKCNHIVQRIFKNLAEIIEFLIEGQLLPRLLALPHLEHSQQGVVDLIWLTVNPIRPWYHG